MQQYPYQQGNEPAGSIFDEEQGEVPVQQNAAAGPSPYQQSKPAYDGPPAPKKPWRKGPKKTARAPRKKADHPPRRRLTWKGRLVAALAVLLVALVGGFTVYLQLATRNDDLWLDLSQIPYKDATIIYAREEGGDWQQYAVLPCTQNKEYVPGDALPRYLKGAFVAVEDKDFYKHHGINVLRTGYAMVNELVHLVTGSYLGGDNGMKVGASTIDQQLVKNLLRDDEDEGLSGYLRKLREIVRAVKLDATYDKDTILSAYLNTISFTDNTAGVQAAARKLFNTTVDQLTVAQAASLAAITRSPARYNPVTQPEQHLQRRNYVLSQMLEEKYITQAQYDEAVTQPVVISGTGVDPERDNTPTSYFTDALMEDVISDLTAQRGVSRAEATRLLYDGGLRIYATVVPSLQSAMEQVMTSASVYPRPGVTVTKALEDENGEPVLDEDGNLVIGPVTVRPQAAMVSLNYSGEVCAVVGGLGTKEVSRGFNRATQAERQVGSTMKPIGPYVLALQQNKITWSSMFLDAPVREVIDDSSGQQKDWPRNFSGSYSKKELTVADALARSINTVAVQVGEKVGVGNIYRFTRNQLGITSFQDQDKDSGPMILGSSTTGVTPLQMAGAYSVFGSGGNFTTPHSYTSACKGDGTVIVAPRVATKQVIDPDTAYIMNRLLAGVMQGAGTASGYGVNDGMDSVGKTGTTSDNRDHWFIGLTPYYVTASWYGYDDNLPLAVNYSAHPPTLGWRNVMRLAQAGLTAKQFPVDTTVQQLEYCTETGLAAGPNCPHKTGYYKAGHGPGEICNQHG
ncbi:MAG: transglycosylase domain-containing protein [Pygmaiobacter sp.]|nr:transglycosylase domain-containing protein [Pygmaiobacter sp.]